MKKPDSKILAFRVEPSQVRYRLRLARYPALTEKLKKFVHDNKGQTAAKYRILDVGVGKGRTFKYAQAEGIDKQFDWHGIDLNRFPPEMRSGGKRWSIKVANIEDGLPYDDDYFDVVVAEQILEHLRDVRFAIDELERITKDGGLIIIGVPIFIPLIARLRNAYIRHAPKLFEKSGSSHIQTFSKKSIQQFIVKNESLSIVDTRGFRILSGGILRPLENYYWWYRLSCWLGKLMPSICVEIQMAVVKHS